jgi:hypothetical protein
MQIAILLPHIFAIGIPCFHHAHQKTAFDCPSAIEIVAIRQATASFESATKMLIRVDITQIIGSASDETNVFTAFEFLTTLLPEGNGSQTPEYDD